MTSIVVSSLAVLVLLLGIAAVLALRRRLRRLRRRLGELRGRIVQLRTRLQPPGPRRDAELLRHRLQAEMRSTREMLESAPEGLIFRADARLVLQELTTAAAAVDRELAAVTRFLDAAQQASALTTLRRQAQQLIDTTYSARQTILRTAAEDRARRLATLQADVARQASALEVYRQTDRELRL